MPVNGCSAVEKTETLVDMKCVNAYRLWIGGIYQLRNAI